MAASKLKVYIDGVFIFEQQLVEVEIHIISSVECIHRLVTLTIWSHVGRESKFLNKCD